MLQVCLPTPIPHATNDTFYSQSMVLAVITITNCNYKDTKKSVTPQPSLEYNYLQQVCNRDGTFYWRIYASLGLNDLKRMCEGVSRCVANLPTTIYGYIQERNKALKITSHIFPWRTVPLIISRGPVSFHDFPRLMYHRVFMTREDH